MLHFLLPSKTWWAQIFEVHLFLTKSTPDISIKMPAHVCSGSSTVHVPYLSCEDYASPLRSHTSIRAKSKGLNMVYEGRRGVSYCLLVQSLVTLLSPLLLCSALTSKIYICHFLCLEMYFPRQGHGLLLWKKQMSPYQFELPQPSYIEQYTCSIPTYW